MARHDRVPEDPARVNARPRGCLILGLIGLTVLVFFAVVYAVYAIRTTADEPVLVTGVEIEKIQPPGFYSLSAQQQDVLSQNGYPDSFLILFYDKTMPNGQRGAIREESWYYHQSGYEVIYRNGEKYTETEQPPEAGDLFRTEYRPEMFIRKMVMEEVLAAAGQDTYLEDPIEKTLLVNADLYFTRGLVFGMSDGELRYLETFPLSQE